MIRDRYITPNATTGYAKLQKVHCAYYTRADYYGKFYDLPSKGPTVIDIQRFSQ